MGQYKFVSFLPWVGKQFHEGLNGHKVLVLGESHYCPIRNVCGDCTVENCMKQGNEEEDFYCMTNYVLDGYVNSYNGDKYQQTFLCFERALLGRQTSEEDRKQLWSHLAFYNYFQKAFYKEDGKRTKPEPRDFDCANEAFKEVLDTLKPDKVIVWGSRLYNCLPNWGGKDSDIVVENIKAPVWTYEIKGRTIQCMRVLHPSTGPGKCWEFWHPFYEEFLK